MPLKILERHSNQMLILVSFSYKSNFTILIFIELIAPTRFSAKPKFGSTFVNFQ